MALNRRMIATERAELGDLVSGMDLPAIARKMELAEMTSGSLLMGPLEISLNGPWIS